ncbi:hypothetical protein [Isoptericola sp. b408]|uniref:hypothetical protein n=1 Tax=Isoptericola sp. b408 TaxID=3064653 RepID=UPI002712F0A0|nr:hypothetical protein [Isoptericola sp. b408]MDO8151713.1 hypothetical protein [Isoptericola sp. b408]
MDDKILVRLRGGPYDQQTYYAPSVSGQIIYEGKLRRPPAVYRITDEQVETSRGTGVIAEFVEGSDQPGYYDTP